MVGEGVTFGLYSWLDKYSNGYYVILGILKITPRGFITILFALFFFTLFLFIRSSVVVNLSLTGWDEFNHQHHLIINTLTHTYIL